MATMQPYHRPADADEEEVSEWDLANWFGKWTFSVANRTLNLGQQRALTMDDLMHLPKHDHSHTLVTAFRSLYHSATKIFIFPKLMVSMWRMHFVEFNTMAIYTFLEGVTRVASPVVLGIFLRDLQDQSVPHYWSFVWASVLTALNIAQTLIHHILFFFSMRMGNNMKMSVIGMIFNKLFEMRGDTFESASTDTGRLVNLISNDVFRFEEAAVFCNFFWEAYLEVFAILIILSFQLNVYAALGGVGVAVLTNPLQIMVARQFAAIRQRTARQTDSRVRYMSEVIHGMASVKAYGWENPFFNLLLSIRNKEIGHIKHANKFRAVNTMLYYIFPQISSFVTFAVFYYTGGKLTLPLVFSTISLFQMLRTSIGRHWTRCLETGSESLASCARIQQFLDLDSDTAPLSPEENVELVQVTAEADEEESNSILSVSRSSYSYAKSPSAVLHDVEFSVHKGELIMVIGPVGSGKSSLLSSILGNLSQVSGAAGAKRLSPHVRIAYCAQRPWVVASTVCANITLAGPTTEYVKDYKHPNVSNKELYARSIECCRLQPDLDMWPNGDQTEIGERGVSISGGQKARVALARAVYSDADLYLLDDPLSAVDANVGKDLFFECILSHLKNEKRRAVILVTHQLQNLQYADKILVLDPTGNQAFFGSYSNLMERASEFTYLDLKHRDHHHETSSNASDDASEPDANGDTEAKPKSLIIQEEDRVLGYVTRKTYTDYLRSGGVICGIWALSLAVIGQALSMIADYWLRWWASDSFNFAGGTYVWAMAIIVFSCIVIGYQKSEAWFAFTRYASLEMHKNCLWAVLYSPIQFFIANPTGRILNRFAKDLNQIDELFPYTAYDFMQCTLYCTSAVILVCISIPWLIILLPALIYTFVTVNRKYLSSSREIKRIEAITRSPIYADFSAALDGLSTLRAYRLEERIISSFYHQLDVNARAWYSFLMASRWLGFRLDMIVTAIVVVTVYLAAALRNSVDVGLIGFALVYTLNLSGLFQWTVRQSAEVENHMTAIERIHSYSNLPQEPGYASTMSAVVKPLVDTTAKGHVEVKNLTVTYRSDLAPVLKSFSLDIPGGCKIGICGRTGCGKSSFLLSLLRLNLITDGDIIIDGKSILTCSLEDARQQITIIPQDPHLFSGDIRFNLDPFNEYTDKQLWDALEDARIKEYIARDPLGLMSRVEENGKNFSVGQRQLLSLARAIVRKRKVILMDEVTASIDYKTDKLIQQTIRESPSLREATIITVAHRLRTIADCDIVAVIDNGSIVEVGRPNNLMEQKAQFYRLAEESNELGEICKIIEMKTCGNN